ncbi:MAG: DUF1844 domain-containing protein [Deltaproteobacteria bacterium]|nr:DUF1844 domain-containing protein [Deltaproteobacteria bacterium]
MSEGEKKPSFKVVDRRRFTDEGDEREGPDVPRADPVRVEPGRIEPAPAAAAPASMASPSSMASSAAPAREPPEAPRPKAKAVKTASGLTFSMFVQSLAQQALMQMGLIPWPHGQRELALEQARDTIDILELLKTKTEGNLEPDENELLGAAVTELKMSFVEVQQAIARSRAGVRPPGPIGPPGGPR